MEKSHSGYSLGTKSRYKRNKGIETYFSMAAHYKLITQHRNRCYCNHKEMHPYVLSACIPNSHPFDFLKNTQKVTIIPSISL